MNRTRALVIYLLILTLMASIPTLMLLPIPDKAEQLLNVVLGFFIAKGGDAVAYLLNSTDGSKAKTDAMLALAEKAQPPAVTPRPDLDIPPLPEMSP